MQRTPMEFPDVERFVVDILDASPWIETDAGIELPDDWTTDSDPFLVVSWDGTPGVDGPAAYPTIRVVAWASSTTAAKAQARRALAVLSVHDGSLGVSAIRPLTGPLPAEDPDSHAPICSFTFRASVRARLLT